MKKSVSRVGVGRDLVSVVVLGIIHDPTACFLIITSVWSECVHDNHILLGIQD